VSLSESLEGGRHRVHYGNHTSALDLGQGLQVKAGDHTGADDCETRHG
jgi:hypothetical protein